MTIREYRAETDFDGLRHCVVELQDYEYRIDNRFPDGESIADAYIQDILERCAQYDGRILVADVGGEIAGYVMIWTKYSSGDIEDGDFVCGLLADLVVLEAHRGRGLGKALMKAGEAYARDCGVTYLRVGVMAGNRLAWKLYEDQGFVECHIELEKRLDTGSG